MARKIQRIEPCLHCWAYYQRKVDARRKGKLPCSQLENMMWDYSMHAAYPFGIVQGAPDKWARLSSTRARKSVTPDADPNLCVDPIW
jgi:hypothetical protein